MTMSVNMIVIFFFRTCSHVRTFIRVLRVLVRLIFISRSIVPGADADADTGFTEAIMPLSSSMLTIWSIFSFDSREAMNIGRFFNSWMDHYQTLDHCSKWSPCRLHDPREWSKLRTLRTLRGSRLAAQLINDARYPPHSCAASVNCDV